MADTDLVLVERHGGSAVLTLNAPHRRNVLSAELVYALGRAVDSIEADPESRCIVVTGPARRSARARNCPPSRRPPTATSPGSAWSTTGSCASCTRRW